MLKLFQKRSPGIKKTDVYAVLTGDYAGEMLIFIEEANEDFCFLSIPLMLNRVIPKEKFKYGITHSIIEKAPSIGSDVYNVCKLQFKQNK